MAQPATPTGIGTALVTGASRRIGAAIARDLARHGWRVAVHYHTSKEAAGALVAELAAAGHTALALAADLADPAAAEALVRRSGEALGPVTCLVNNAAEFRYDDIRSLTPASWARHMDIDLRAPVLLARALAAHLPDGVSGNVVNLVDQRVHDPGPEFFSYTLAKAGLATATRMLARALAPQVRVNAIAPGPVLANIHQSEAEFAAEWGATLLGRATAPEEIAAAVRFVLDAPAMTGQIIVLDGGQHLAWRSERRAGGT